MAVPVARKHGGNQDMGWTLTMRQLYEKSGSAARLSDFALDIRKIVAADALPEYALTLGLQRAQRKIGDHGPPLPARPLSDPRFQPSGRRLGNGKPGKAARHGCLSPIGAPRHGLLGASAGQAIISIIRPARDYHPNSDGFPLFWATRDSIHIPVRGRPVDM